MTGLTPPETTRGCGDGGRDRLPAAHDPRRFGEDVTASDIPGKFDPLFAAYREQRYRGERFGDFVIRAGHLAQTRSGPRFQQDVVLS